MAEVEDHKHDRWIVIDDDVYCLASMTSHTGSLDIIDELSGRNVTRIFYEIHRNSTTYKELLNRNYRIGKLDRISDKNQEVTDSYFLKKKLLYNTLPHCNIPNVISFDDECAMKEQFRQYIMRENFPCMGAKIAIRRNAFGFGYYDMFACKHTTTLLWHHLIDFINYQSSLWENGHMLNTYVACFRTPKDIDELVFERLLWEQLQLIHAEDVKNGMEWAENYSDDPIDPNFGFSVGRRAFFVVGLHPHSSRKARQFSTPTIVFNSLDQFTNLRQLKMLTNLRQIIRNTDQYHNQSINPNLIPNDNHSIAFEYSGKLIQSGWIPNFRSLHQTSNPKEHSL